MTPEQEKVRSLLVDTITLLCRNGLTFTSDVKLQGLLAITIDSKEFFVVQIDETLAENLADNQVDCGQPEQLAMSQAPSMRKREPQNIPLSFRKRAQPVTDELNSSKNFRRRSSQKDLLAGNFPDRFSDNLSSLSAQVKVEDDDLLLLDSSGNSVVSQSYDYGNAGGDSRPGRKDFCDSLMATGATPGSSRSSHGKQRQSRKRAGQWNTFEGIDWTGQGDISSLAVNYGLDETEDKHQPESQQDMTTTLHPVQLSEADWTSIDDSGHWDPQNKDRVSQGSNALLVYEQLLSTKRSSASTAFKPFACRFPGCQKRFYHETHTRRHERETHNYYRQRQKHLQPSTAILSNSISANVFGASSSDQQNGAARRHPHHQQQQSREQVVASGVAELASSSGLLHVFTDSDQQTL